MSFCVTIIGLLCVAGRSEPLLKMPRLWLEQRAVGDDFRVVFIGSDNRRAINSTDLLKTCRNDLCVRSYGVPVNCGMMFHVFKEGGAAPDEGDYYVLTAPSASAYARALSKIWAKPSTDNGAQPLELNQIGALKEIPFSCNGAPYVP